MSKEFYIEREWESKAGLKCVVTVCTKGFRCGYVGIEKSNPLFEQDYLEHSEILEKFLEERKNQPIGKMSPVSAFCWDGESCRPNVMLNVHGGITYSGGGKKTSYPIESDLWWFGYDCTHLYDGSDVNLMSKNNRELHQKFHMDMSGIIRSLEYCTLECESLAKQIIEMTGEKND